jgi:8-oxo-dGTP pyrophosphatase MutT (NUDIX family)
MSSGVNRETVERRRRRLFDEYDDVYVQNVTHEFDDEEDYRDLLETARKGYTGGGYAWVVREPDEAAALTESMPDEVDDGRRVLMILGRGGSRWGVPGGGREDGETYEEAAVREVREETSVECELTGLFLLRDLTLTPPGGDANGSDSPAIHTLWAFFDADYTGGHIAIQPGELNGAAWFDEPPREMHPENVHRATDFWDDYEYDGDPFADFYDEASDDDTAD